MGDSEQALKYHEDYKEISDFLKNSESNTEIGRLAAEYEFNQREAELLAANRQAELISASTIKQQRTLLIASITVIVLSGLVMIGMYRNFHQKKTNNYLLNLKNQEIQDQAEKLRASNMVKDRIFSMIAHDLRGPLSSLFGVISLIEMNKASQEELDKLIPNVARRFKYTSTLLNNLLQWAQSQMEGYRINPEVFDINMVVSNKRALLQTNIEEKGLNFHQPKGEFLVYADLNMIDLVVQNLLSNAIKFSNKEDDIKVAIATEGDTYKVSVHDTGIGIKRENLQQLFSGTFFSTKGTMDEKGTGLGLMLCKEFVEKNNGEIVVNSTYGKGSIFSFTLPIAKE
jgi:signal transduction histidine kinase